MTELSRRKFLTGAPAVAVVAAVGVGLGVLPSPPVKYARPNLTLTLEEFASRILNPAMDRLRDSYEAA